MFTFAEAEEEEYRYTSWVANTMKQLLMHTLQAFCFITMASHVGNFCTVGFVLCCLYIR